MPQDKEPRTVFQAARGKMKALLKVLVDRCAQECARRRTGDIYLRTADMCVEGVEVDGDKNIRARLVRLRTDAGKVVCLTDQDIMARLPQESGRRRSRAPG